MSPSTPAQTRAITASASPAEYRSRGGVAWHREAVLRSAYGGDSWFSGDNYKERGAFWKSFTKTDVAIQRALDDEVVGSTRLRT